METPEAANSCKRAHKRDRWLYGKVPALAGGRSLAHDSADRASREAATAWVFQHGAHKARGAAVDACAPAALRGAGKGVL
jgi:hypothetical protein